MFARYSRNTQRQKHPQRQKLHLAIAAAASLALGAGYYLFFRIAAIDGLTDPTGGSFPSLIHMLVLTWVAFALTDIKRGLGISVALLLVSIAAEWQIGYASTLDTIMLVVGFCIASATSVTQLRAVPEVPLHTKQSAGSTSLAGISLLLCSLGFITGTSPFCQGQGGGNCGPERRIEARPIYMDYQTLRSSITVSDPRPLKDISRVYVYQGAVFLNSKNQGIHVLDNSDPNNPRNVAFIEIPGNTEISIRSNHMYVDSYVDLVTLNISDPQNVQEEDREQEIFPYDEYQNVPEDIYFREIDESRGVVISYARIN